jgi:hypothetical protein
LAAARLVSRRHCTNLARCSRNPYERATDGSSPAGTLVGVTLGTLELWLIVAIALVAILVGLLLRR